MVKSLGVIEVKGIAAAFKALDEMVKAFDVKFAGSEKTLGSGLVSVIIEGSTSLVAGALEKGRKTAELYKAFMAEAMLPNPHPELYRLIKNKWSDVNTSPGGGNCVGSIEVYGYAGFIAAADAALKAGNVRLARYGTVKGKIGTPGLILVLRVYGSVEDVRAAVNAGVIEAEKASGVITRSINTGLHKQVFYKYIEK